MHTPLRPLLLCAALLLPASLLLSCDKELNAEGSETPASATPTAPSCSTRTVFVHSRPPLFTWIDHYADGRRDTVWAPTREDYVGTRDTTYTLMIQARDIVHLNELAWTLGERDTLVCEGDELWQDELGKWNWRAAGHDTTWLNWGPHAQDSLTRPRVHIDNKAQIQYALASVSPLDNYNPISLDISHFAGDSLRLQVESPTPALFRLGYVGDGYCPPTDYCENYVSRCHYASLFFTQPALGIDFATSPETGDYDWKLIVRNRFGYADTLVGSTRIEAPACPATDYPLVLPQPL